MDRLKSPKPLNLDGNLLQNLKSWKQDSILFMTTIEYDKEPDNVKSNLLLHCTGERSAKVYNTLNVSTTADSMELKKIIEQFKAYLNPRKKYYIFPVQTFYLPSGNRTVF